MPASYPFDPTGLAPTNLITDEIQTLTEINAQPYRIIIPKFAPFYLGNLQLKHVDQNGETTILDPDVDYTVSLPFIGASRSIGQMLYGGLSINADNLNGLIKVSYRSLGGDWVADPGYVLEALAESNYNSRITVWDVVTNIQQTFPPINHDQSLDYVYGYQTLIDAINQLAAQVAQGPSTSNSYISHILNTNNPHEVNKAQVGLPDVVNMPLATDEEIINLEALSKYISLSQAITLFQTLNTNLIKAQLNQAQIVYLSKSITRRLG